MWPRPTGGARAVLLARIDGAVSARVLCRCGGDGADAAATEATGARHRRHATVSSASLRSSWWGRAIGHVGAHRFDAVIVSAIAAPTRDGMSDGHCSNEASAGIAPAAARSAVCASACTPHVPVKVPPCDCLYSEIYLRKSDLRRRTRNAQRAAQPLLASSPRLTGRDELA